MARNLRNLRGKVVLITGGAQGIGRKTAEAFVAQGAKVAIGDLDVDLAKKAADEIGGDVLALPLDVSDYDQFAKFIEDAEKALGPIDVLVNNAGVMIVGDIVDEPQRVTDKQLMIDLNSVIFGSREAAKRFVPRRCGHIINIASLAGKIGVPGLSSYNAAKYGVVGFSEALRGELRPYGVEVTTIMPLFIQTALIDGLDFSRSLLLKIIPPQPVEKVANAIVHSAAGRGKNQFVPGWTLVFDPLLALLRWAPRLMVAFTKILGLSDILTGGKVNTSARKAYIERTTGQAQ
ncbi:short-chain dehydrogenase/reductase SDR [Segniliparus rotundus DSM 44985]|uniref:Short-chain dehydrogenase/reductase SDR n=1 Tax=Segniliparus rotundus (strain ATCC BAA-972 / CDC 1076 / CIP 108378 / DSM 44985 / JCM 13578) TaxID=640132 RepID=D6ZDD6_SEGRD|nr:SDR family oxidoreductase [Segniliparus rotundus]ADG97200.1 short-chain dehydrogenase/reductase SDR [Segniliparus rotundus DSM 44985]